MITVAKYYSRDVYLVLKQSSRAVELKNEWLRLCAVASHLEPLN